MKFRAPKHIVQIFDNSYEFTKESRSFEDRKKQYAWKKEIASYSGKLEGDMLWLNESQFNQPELDKADFIFLLDHNSDSIRETSEKFGYLQPHKIHELRQVSPSKQLQILNEEAEKIEHFFYTKFLYSVFRWKCFRFHFDEAPVIDLDYDEFKLGKPKRDNFTICRLEKEYSHRNKN